MDTQVIFILTIISLSITLLMELIRDFRLVRRSEDASAANRMWASVANDICFIGGSLVFYVLGVFSRIYDCVSFVFDSWWLGTNFCFLLIGSLIGFLANSLPSTIIDLILHPKESIKSALLLPLEVLGSSLLFTFVGIGYLKLTTLVSPVWSIALPGFMVFIGIFLTVMELSETAKRVIFPPRILLAMSAIAVVLLGLFATVNWVVSSDSISDAMGLYDTLQGANLIGALFIFQPIIRLLYFTYSHFEPYWTIHLTTEELDAIAKEKEDTNEENTTDTDGE